MDEERNDFNEEQQEEMHPEPIDIVEDSTPSDYDSNTQDEPDPLHEEARYHINEHADHIEASHDSVLYSNDDLMIRRKIDAIDKQVAEFGNYTEYYLDEDGNATSKQYTAKEAQDLRYKLLQESEKLQKVGWLDRSYKEWSLKWIVAKIANAIRYVIDPLYRSMRRDAAVMEHRADLDAQYKAFVERKSKIIQEGMETPEKEQAGRQQPERASSPFVSPTTDAQQKETQQSIEQPVLQPEQKGPAAKPDPDYEKRKMLYDDIDSIMQTKNVSKEDAIVEKLSQYPRDIAYLSRKDVTEKIAKAAFDAAIAYRKESCEKRNEPFGDKQRWDQTRYLVGKYPALMAAFPIEEQKRMFISVALRNPETLTYMKPEIGNDPELAKKLAKAIVDIRDKNVREGKEAPDYNTKVLVPLMTTYKDLGAVPAFLPHMENTFGKDFLNGLVGIIPEEIKSPEQEAVPPAPVVEMPAEPTPEVSSPRIPEPDQIIPEQTDVSEPPPQYTDRFNVAYEGMTPFEFVENIGQNGETENAASIPAPDDGFSGFDFASAGLPGDSAHESAEPPLQSWQDDPVFQEAIFEAKENLEKMTNGFPVPESPEIIKAEVIHNHPELFKHLPDEEKTTNVIIDAVSQNISNIKHVPEPEKLPEYIDRDELKQQIMDQVCRSVIETARESGRQPMEILRGQVCKTSRNDTKEAEEMKKTLRNKGFELNQRMEREISAGEEH